MYWLPGALFMLLDLALWPEQVRQYKVQPGTNEPVPTWALIKCVLVANFNQVVLSVPFLWGCYHLMLLKGEVLSPVLPSLPSVVFDILVSLIPKEITFYYFHRLLHHRWLYKYFHKMHHEWQSPVGVVGDYTHPLEHILVTMIPLMVGPLLLGSHLVTIWVLAALASIGTIINHCGYHLPLLPSPEYHDYHHLKFTECYGNLGILDYLHGTDRKFRQSVNYLRHKTLYALEPLTHTFPGEKKASASGVNRRIKKH
ncbi:Fatty acid hydroxylase domain-containing protein 2 [Chionoecetes opilio]|uniref:Fatty acid hydroxylase domain-containing protein 2 n=1 Tax=Chionoecetes opilio TaxID=41210 RepID=A0A8J4Y7E0_CHIOP|nr:Fatty acid hydroxylase domain-containing protein 2 [Chionoecetes opilio]